MGAKRMMSSFLRMKLSTLAILAFFTAVGFGCGTPNEGDRCNPSLSHDECGGSNLVCAIPANCNPANTPHSPYANGEAYCCPANGTSTNANCDGSCNPCEWAASLAGAPAWCYDGAAPNPPLYAEVE
jgi:hypothetical protein